MKALQEPRRKGTLLRRWLATVTRRHALNWARGRRRSKRREERVARVEGSSNGPDPDVILAYREVMDAMGRLQLKQKEVLLLRFHDQMDFRQIAKKLDIKEGAARVRLHRALDALRKSLGEDGKQWRKHCLVLAPGALRKPAPVLPLPSWPVSLVGLLLLTVVAGLWWWNGEPGVPEPTSGQEASLDSAEVPLADESLPPGEGMERSELLAPVQEPTSLPPVDRTLQGRVLRLTEGVSGAEVHIWQPTQERTVFSEHDGSFAIDLLQGEGCVITAMSEGFSRRKTFSSTDNGPYIVHLPPPSEREPTRVFVHDVDSGEAISGAQIQIYTHPSLWESDLADQSSFLAPVLEIQSDSNGMASFVGYTQDLRIGFHVESKDYLPSWSELGGFGSWDDGLVHHVYLNKSKPKQIQILNDNGEPLVGARVRSGYPPSPWFITGEDGEFSQVKSWSLSQSIVVGNKHVMVPTAIVVDLPSGGSWESNVANMRRYQVRLDGENLQLLIGGGYLMVTLNCTSLKEGEWIEAQPRSLHEENARAAAWKKIYSNRLTRINRPVQSGRDSLYLRLMPQGFVLGPYPINESKENQTIDLEIARTELVLLRTSINTNEAAFAEVFWHRGIPVWTLPFVDGRVEVPYKSDHDGFQVKVRDADGELLFLEYQRSPARMGSSFFLRSGKEDYVFKEISGERRLVTVKVNGVEAIGGTAGGNPISPSGQVEVMLGNDGRPKFRQARIELPAILHQQGGGPILSNFSSPNGMPSIGKIVQGPGEQWIWEMELAEVELFTPINETEDDEYLSESIQGLESWFLYPYHLPDEDMTVLRAKASGGWLAFRVPAGRYRFNVGEHYFAGEEGVDILPGRINRLKPIDLEEPDDE